MQANNYVTDSSGNSKFRMFESFNHLMSEMKSADGEHLELMPSCAAGMRVTGKLNTQKLIAAVNAAYRDIDSMRAVIVREKEENYFRVLNEYSISNELIRPDGDTPDERYKNVTEQCQRDVSDPGFYSECGCPIKLYELGEDDYFFLIALNHHFGDYESLALIIKKIMLGYYSLPGGKGINKNGIIDFHEFYESYLASEKHKEDERYWESLNEGIEKLFVRNPQDDTVSELTPMDCMSIFPLEQLTKTARKYKTSVPNLMQSVYMLALSCVYNTSESAVAVAFANRQNKEFADTVAHLSTLLLTRTDIPDNADAKDFFKQVMNATAENMKHAPMIIKNRKTDYFIFDYMTKKTNSSPFKGAKTEVWTPKSFDINSFDFDSIFTASVETDDKLIMSYNFNKSNYSNADFIKLRDKVIAMVALLSENGDVTVSELKNA